jgi:predicted MFS family arabinose efflux permease
VSCRAARHDAIARPPHAGRARRLLAKTFRKDRNSRNDVSRDIFLLSPTTLSPPKVHAPLSASARRAVALTVPMQMLGWGTTYHLPILLGGQFSADLHLAPEVVFGGLTIMLVTSALIAPRIGRMVDAHGPRWFLIAGSLCCSVGLFALANAQGLALYALAWLMFGLALATMLGNAAFVALARVAGPQARRAISTLLLFSAANSFLFYPLTSALAGHFGWRTMCLIYAAAHIVVGLPLQLMIGSLKPAPRPAADEDEAIDQDAHGALPPGDRRSAMLLVIIAFAANGFIGWGVSPHLVNLLGAVGVSAALAVFLASLHGPAQIIGRFMDYGFGAKLTPIALGMIATTLAPVALVGLIFAGQSTAVAVATIAIYGVSTGLSTVMRAAIPLSLFGRLSYGATLGRIALPMNIACAIAPIFFASLIARAGPTASLMVGAGVATLAVIAMMLLDRKTRASANAVAGETVRV